MKCLDIKTGSILIYKKYGLLKCWWNKLMGKELPLISMFFTLEILPGL